MCLSPSGVCQFFLFSPTVAIMQWRNEINAHTDGLKVLVWHGGSRESDIEALKKYDVVSDIAEFKQRINIVIVGLDHLRNS